MKNSDTNNSRISLIHKIKAGISSRKKNMNKEVIQGYCIAVYLNLLQLIHIIYK